MKRLSLVLVVIICVSITASEAKKKEKQWKTKHGLAKAHHTHRHGKPTEIKTPLTVNFNSLTTSKKIGLRDHFGYKIKKHNVSWLKNKKSKRKHGHDKPKHGKHHKVKGARKGKEFKLQKHTPWLDILSDEKCSLGCKKHEVCIMGPVDAKPLCVHVKDLKKSVKLFRKYQRKEKKAWKKFHKKNYRHMKKEDVYGLGFNKGEETFAAKWDKENIARKKKALMRKQEVHKKHPTFAVKATESKDTQVCSTSDFAQMRTRLTGWFHVLHGQDKSFQKMKAFKHSVKKQLEVHSGNHCECLKSAMWEFRQLDNDKDEQLTKAELATFGENAMEPCIKPYIISCDSNADGLLSSDEWCCCFSHVLAPCYRRMDDIRKSGKKGAFMPRCDKEGYYMSEQCDGHQEDGNLTCWCVDYNGNVLENTKTHGRIDCSKYPMYDHRGQSLFG